MTYVLSSESISKSFKHKSRTIDAIKNVTLQLRAGEFLAIRGKSGCGKSTLLLTLGGLQKPNRGRVEVANQDVYQMRQNARATFRAQNIGFVFQQFHLIPYLNVLENVQAAEIGLPRSLTNSNGRAHELIEQVGLLDRIDHKPSELSMGECQRVAMARALLNRPKLILADEPTGNLDTENTAALLASLRTAADNQTAILLVTHDGQCESVVDRVIQMADGELEH